MTDDNVVPFNPLDKRHLGESVGQAMLRRPVVPLANLEQFRGAGIYAIYYTGEFSPYEVIAERNREGRFMAPIYVGKAIPKGARKGGTAVGTNPGFVLHSRLNQHRNSIHEVDNLRVEDFHCRFLIVDDIWIPLGEQLLIAKFNPLWNAVLDGFGNHDPGAGRRNGARPRWDVVHPGRGWAELCQPRNETAQQITREAVDFLENNPPPDDVTMITT